MMYAEIQFTRPMQFPPMKRPIGRLVEVNAKETPNGLVIGDALIPWVHVLFARCVAYGIPAAVEVYDHMESPAEEPPSAPNRSAMVSGSPAAEHARRGHPKRAGKPHKP